MDIETLTLVKLLLVAGLAWLSCRKIRRMQAQQQQIKSRHEACILQQMPIIEKIKIKQESCLSTSATSKPNLTYSEYNIIYDQFWEQDNSKVLQDNRMDIEWPLQTNQSSEFITNHSQKSAAQTQIDSNNLQNQKKSYSQNILQQKSEDFIKRRVDKLNWRERLKAEIQDKSSKSIINQYKKTILKQNKSHLFPKNR